MGCSQSRARRGRNGQPEPASSAQANAGNSGSNLLNNRQSVQQQQGRQGRNNSGQPQNQQSHNSNQHSTSGQPRFSVDPQTGAICLEVPDGGGGLIRLTHNADGTFTTHANGQQFTFPAGSIPSNLFDSPAAAASFFAQQRPSSSSASSSYSHLFTSFQPHHRQTTNTQSSSSSSRSPHSFSHHNQHGSRDSWAQGSASQAEQERSRGSASHTSYSDSRASGQPSSSTAHQQASSSSPNKAGSMAPSGMYSKQAEQLKAEGNTLFTKAKYAAAIEKYTEAITLTPDWPVLFVNRAMCHKKREDWDHVLEDSARALQLNKDLMKAHYLQGLGRRHRQQYAEAISHLQKALEAAREAGDNIKDEIWHELATAKYRLWEVQSHKRKEEHARLRQQLQMMREQSGQGMSQEDQKAWEQLFQGASWQDAKTESPSLFTCPLTMEIFRDPVTTPSGHSYEKSALMEHLRKVGRFDPITRKPMSENDVYPNLGLRAAIQQYLDEHPWAWGDCM